MCLIFKSTDCTQPLNYCPISLTRPISKLLKDILHTEIINYLEGYNVILEHEHALGYSCKIQLAGILHHLNTYLDL